MFLVTNRSARLRPLEGAAGGGGRGPSEAGADGAALAPNETALLSATYARYPSIQPSIPATYVRILLAVALNKGAARGGERQGRGRVFGLFPYICPVTDEMHRW